MNCDRRIDLSGLNDEERDSVETIVAGLLTKHMLVEQRDAAARATEERCHHETAWMVELASQQHLCIGTCGRGFIATTFTDGYALLFARREDAERFASAMKLCCGWANLIVVEHRFG